MSPDPSPRLLLVEDDRPLAAATAARLRAEGFAVEVVHDGRAAVLACEERPPAAVVLDVVLPGLDGLEVCRRVQAVRPVPVLMLTARDDEADLLVGLAVGADDYLTKPFRSRELVARVRALLRRVERAAAAGPAAAPVALPGGARLDPRTREVHDAAGAPVHLTATEHDLLARLAADPGAVVRREDLLADVWGWAGGAGSTRTVDSHVRSLRRKLGDAAVRTVVGVGYALGQRGAP